jgi:AcrR family transcriptional regulator
MHKPRPGGRTAETRSAVFAATAELLAERHPADISVTDIAERAGVAATSIYRRWKDIRTLMTEVAVERLTTVAPLPDTGSLRGDLIMWTRSIVASLGSPGGSAFFQVYVGAAPRTPEEGAARVQAMTARLGQIESMLDRARNRGETTPSIEDVSDYVLAPLYMRAVFGALPTMDTADRLIERLLKVISSIS